MESLTGFSQSQLDFVSQLIEGSGAAGAASLSYSRKAPRIPRCSDTGTGQPVPVSFGQSRLYLMQQLDPASATYNLQYRFRLQGSLDVAKLESSLLALVERHETLRTHIELRGSQLQQIVEPVPARLLGPIHDLQEIDSDSERDTRRLSICDQHWAQPFDLSAGPPCRFLLIRIGQQEHILCITVHHVATDGWSTGILLDDLAALYRAEPLPPIPVRYSDYAKWQREAEQAKQTETSLLYWKEKLAGAPAALELPTTYPRPSVQRHAGSSFRLELPSATVAGLRSIGQQERSSLFMVLLSLFSVLLARYSRQDDIVIGTPVSGRDQDETARVAGFFVNTIPLRNHVTGNSSFRELLRNARDGALDAFEHANAPFEQIVDSVVADRDLSRSPVFQVMMAQQNEQRRDLCVTPDLRLTQESTPEHHSMFDLSIAFEDSSELSVNLIYDTALFDAAYIERMADHLATLAQNAIRDPDAPISSLDLLTAAERDRILSEWSLTEKPYDSTACIHSLIAEQASRTPSAPSVVFEGRQLTYRELDERSNQLARYLTRCGAGPESPVGLCLPRNENLLVAVLGILKCGAAYVPLDPNYPPDRLRHMLADSGAKVLLTSHHVAPTGLSCAKSVDLESAWPHIAGESTAALPENPAEPQNAAYIIYTSGSTGKPKGVVIEHAAAAAFIAWALQEFPIEDLRRTLASTSVCFDLSVFEMFVPLCAGGTVVVAANALDLLNRASVARTATLVNTVPSAAAELAASLPGCVRTLNVAGEPLLPDLARKLHSQGTLTRLCNLYGPTETTTYSTCATIAREDERPPSIGTPIANTSIYVLDANLAPLPAGVPGEVYIGGAGLSRGYAGRPGATAERYLPDPYSKVPGARFYYTGDLARWRTDGTLEYLGRVDHQVKIRGFRIELGEIEAALTARPEIDQAIVVAHDFGGSAGKQLVAYYTQNPGFEPPSAQLLRNSLRASLPEFMAPAWFVPLKQFPRTPNGKVDRRALPVPERASSPASEPPSTATEATIHAIFLQLLPVESLGVQEGFFEAGGHSLLAMQVVSRLRDAFGIEVPLRRLFENPSVRQLASFVDGVLESSEDSERAERPKPLARTPRTTAPLSFGQQRMLFLHQMDPESTLYHLPLRLRLRGNLDRDALMAALTRIEERHETLRTVFQLACAGPVQKILPAAQVAPVFFDLSNQPLEQAEAELERLLSSESGRPFDLLRDAPWRAALVRVSERDHVLLLTFHHIACDGWSLEILGRELQEFYAASQSGRSSTIAEPPVQYSDFTAWQSEWLSDERFEAQLAYWKSKLEGVPSEIPLPWAKPRPAMRSGHGASLSTPLDQQVLAHLEGLGASVGATPFMTLLAAFQVFLFKYSGLADLAVGTPVAGRTRKEIEPLIGFFVNTLVMRTSLEGRPSFREVVKRVRDAAVEAYAHLDIPFERLVEELQPERDPSRTPLFQSLFTVSSSQGLAAFRLENLDVEAGFVHAGSAKFDLSLAIQTSGEPSATWNYSTDLLDEATMLRMMRHFGGLLESLAAKPDLSIEELSLASPEEEAAVHRINEAACEHPYPRNETLQALFESIVESYPKAVAIESDSAELGYENLNRLANHLARKLQKLGVRKETPVAICVDRSMWTLVAILATVKCGGFYVPLDPDHPVERKQWMIEDTGARFVLTIRQHSDSLPGGGVELLCIDEMPSSDELNSGAANPPDINRPEDLAYVMYTSGSTGKPKGIGITHRGIVRLVKGTNYVQLDATERMGMISNPAFDASTFEIWGALLNGGRLIVIDKEIALQPGELSRFLGERRVSSMFLTAAIFQQTARDAPGAFRGMKHLLAGGDVVDGASVRAVLQPGRRPQHLINGYGPTENTTFSCCYDVRSIGVADATIPIGPPIANSTAYVLDGEMRMAPPGVTGELYLGGDGLARGYWNRPDLTAERFVPHPFLAGARLYRTGDLARFRPDGCIDFLGRTDHQVKIRGFRIEPAEIQAALECHPAVSSCAVVVREDGPARQKRLVAYVVAAHQPADGVSVSGLKEYLRKRLPHYMVPEAFVLLSSLPLNANGKLDRRALPEPAQEAGSTGESYVEPRNPIEQAVAAIFGEVLRRNSGPGIHENFFDLGGHSLSAMQVVTRVRSLFGRQVSLRAFFEAPTVAGLAACIDGPGQIQQDDPIPVAAEPVASYSQTRLLFLQQFEPGSGQYNVPLTLRLKGELSIAALTRSIEAIARRHEVLRTHFRVEDGDVRLVVTPPQPINIRITRVNDASEAERLVAEETMRPFDLTSGPVWRHLLIQVEAEEHLLVVTTHHVAIDGWSLGILSRELAGHYEHFTSGDAAAAALPELRVQYSGYAAWQRKQLDSGEGRAQLRYWQEQLQDPPPPLELPLALPRPAVRCDRGASVVFEIPDDVTASLKALCRQENATLFMALLAAYHLLLSRYSGQNDLLIGTPVAGRRRKEAEDLIGFFVNTLALRLDLTGDLSFRERLVAARTTALDAYANQDTPIEKLVEELAPARDLSRPPLFQTMLALQNTPPLEWRLKGLRLSLEPTPKQTAKFDLTLLLTEVEGGLKGELVYAASLFEGRQIARMASHFTALVRACASQPDAPGSTLANSTVATPSPGLTAQNADTGGILGEFHEQACQNPDAVAVVAGTHRLSYRELDARSTAFAVALRNRGVRSGQVVALHSIRTPGMVIAILGVLKVGAAYAPLDPQQPAGRWQAMVEASQAVLTIGVDELERLSNSSAPDVSVNPPDRPPGSSLAYVIFTSGSTGAPKGVGVEHRQVASYVQGVRQACGAGVFREGASFALIQPLHVDASVTFLFGALCSGGCLHLLPELEDTNGAAAVADYLERNAIDAFKAAPSHLAALWESAGPLRQRALLPRKALFVGGEGARMEFLDTLQKLRPDLAIYNQYGPTETTVGVTLWRYEPKVAHGSTAPIGSPFPGVSIYVIDSNGALCPEGAKGEVFAGGASVTRGYLGNPALTAARYLPDPFSSVPGSRMYQTGDLARWSVDGAMRLEYLGRADDQVKIRGFRVELGEVEAALAAVPGVAECACGVPGATGCLTAYVAWTPGKEGSLSNCLERLRAALPGYMVPIHWAITAGLPRTRHGKLDRRALELLPAAPLAEAANCNAQATPPRNGLESLLCLLWASVMKLERVHVHDDFFELGGHSLLAMQIASRMRQVFDMEIPLRAMFEAPTVARLAEALHRYEKSPGQAARVAAAFEQMRAAQHTAAKAS